MEKVKPAPIGPPASGPRRARLSRAEQNALNRARLLDAALSVFAAKGYHGASLDEVAEAAGFSKGAVYSRFQSKADLMLALMDRVVRERVARVEAIAESTQDYTLEAFQRANWDDLANARDWLLLTIEFRVHAFRDPELRARYAGFEKRHRDVMTDAILARLPGDRSSKHAKHAAQEAARVLLALGAGAMLSAATDPDGFSTAVFSRATDGIMQTLLLDRPGDSRRR